MASLGLKSLRYTAFSGVRYGVPQPIAELVAFNPRKCLSTIHVTPMPPFLRGWQFPRRRE
jgi:hypothetical protein